MEPDLDYAIEKERRTQVSGSHDAVVAGVELPEWFRRWQLRAGTTTLLVEGQGALVGTGTVSLMNK